MTKEIVKKAFIKSIPIMCSYIFVSMAYGIMMAEAGFSWIYSLGISLSVYTGAFQFVLITFLSSGASLLTVAVTAFLMNSRQTFYSLSFLDEFKGMGIRLPYMIHTMTDETYAVNLTLEEGKDKKDIMFLIALFSRVYWMFGAVLGGILGQFITYDMTGIDFCMTALFLIIMIDQWEKSKNHLPAVLGLSVALLCLLIIGPQNFMLPALLIVSGILLLLKDKEVNNDDN
ncbi:MAG: AzlC family ABC transporter permease [Erysipelotrichaceae bacterium]|nr:AzlC family ABC transporter permease [Erysipelotrichaceae bacterium]